MLAGLFSPWPADGHSVPVSPRGFSPVKNILISLCVQFSSSQPKRLLLRKILPEYPVWSNHGYFPYHLLNSRLCMAFPFYTHVSVYLLIIWLLLLPTCTPPPPSHRQLALWEHKHCLVHHGISAVKKHKLIQNRCSVSICWLSKLDYLHLMSLEHLKRNFWNLYLKFYFILFIF